MRKRRTILPATKTCRSIKAPASNKRPQSCTCGPQGSQTNYYYDKNGNLIDDGIYLYYYDCENRLTDVNDQSDDPVASYAYDYLGRRVAKIVDGNTTKYCYDGDQVIAEYYNGTLVRKFIYGLGIDELICMIDVADSNKVYYYHFDGLGSIEALSDVNSVIIEQYSYDVFGQPSTTSSIDNPYMFTGRRFDPETALYYYRARYYAPDIGRFLQTDPIGYYGGLNLYTYVGNNPLNWIDPWGLWEEEDHQSLGRYGRSGRFDYGRLDRDYSPHSRHWRRHFRNRDNVRRDLEDACRRSDSRAFEYHMHEMQDTYSHGEGIWGGLSHLWRRHEPDDVSRHRRAYEEARRETERWEDEWDGYNPPEPDDNDGKKGS